MLDPWLTARLDDRRKKQMLRSLPAETTQIDFTSNDYLGLARSEALNKAIHKRLASLPHLNGSTGSRLLSGNFALAAELEGKLAAIFRSEAALLFNSGYTANLAVLSAIPRKGDTILYDELAHASIKDGARLSLAHRYSFRHNDLNDLERKLSRCQGRTFIAVESIYSMDGDECPLRDLIGLAEKHGSCLILDEAHSTGVRGPQGAGISVESNLAEHVDVRIYTFGKGMGVCGACVAGSLQLRDYLLNFARPLIYTTAPSPYAVVAVEQAFAYLSANEHLQETLRDRIKWYCDGTSSLQNRTQSGSAIQTCIVPGNERVKNVARDLQLRGFDVRPILYPTVPRDSERLRICLHVYNTESEINALTGALRLIG